MGILNLTPDSLWAGAGPIGEDEAAERLLAMRADGAAICDVGAESTRPGSDPVPPDEQLHRLAGVLDAMRGAAAGVPVSIDTSSARVAEAVLDAGAVLVNDVTAGRGRSRPAAARRRARRGRLPGAHAGDAAHDAGRPEVR